MGPTFDLPGLQRQHRVGPVDGLELGLLVDREHERVVGLVEVEPDDVDERFRAA